MALKDVSQQPKAVDPDLLQLIGAAADLVGLGEHLRRLLPIDRLRARRRHERIDRLRDRLRDHLNDARVALRVVSSVVATEIPGAAPADFAIAIPRGELPVFRKGLDQLQVAIREMTKDTYELESVAASMPDEVQRYYRMSEGGRTLISGMHEALEGVSESTQKLLRRVEEYLERCDHLLAEGDEWRTL